MKGVDACRAALEEAAGSVAARLGRADTGPLREERAACVYLRLARLDDVDDAGEANAAAAAAAESKSIASSLTCIRSELCDERAEAAGEGGR